MSKKSPRVSIGLPVYNGENFLAAAVDSILGQTYPDFELILSDNCSTDRTEEICRHYALRDSRIRYIRNDRNLGAHPNYNQTVNLATGEYFKWAAHDDLLSSEWLEKCVDLMDKNPDAVLCHSLVKIIDNHDNPLSIYDSNLQKARSRRASERFGDLILFKHLCSEVFGLIRSNALHKTSLLGFYRGSDRAFLAELSLTGRFVYIPEPLICLREHPDRYSRATKAIDRARWHKSDLPRSIGYYTWHLYTDYIHFVSKHVEDVKERLCCYGHLVHWWFVSWNSLRILTDIVTEAFPSLYPIAEKAKNRLVKPLHPLSKKTSG
ncbi:MAG: glycosyltransferase family 2 protein [Gammaproteobacteria bacterium]